MRDKTTYLGLNDKGELVMIQGKFWIWADGRTLSRRDHRKMFRAFKWYCTKVDRKSFKAPNYVGLAVEMKWTERPG